MPKNLQLDNLEELNPSTRARRFYNIAFNFMGINDTDSLVQKIRNCDNWTNRMPAFFYRIPNIGKKTWDEVVIEMRCLGYENFNKFNESTKNA